MKRLSFVSFVLLFISLIPPTFFPQNLPVIDKQTFSAFIDSLITYEMEQSDIPGAAISVVYGGEIFYAKGYGYADLASHAPVSADSTLFRTASVCKTVTATAIMQLVEKEILDLDADVNTYLKKFKVRETFEEPITLRHLLTHTAGFDDEYIGKSAKNQADQVPLGEFLQKHLPERIVEPGEVYMYSNLGIALAAYIAEETIGQDFEEYVKENIFRPLGMNTSCFRYEPWQEKYLAGSYFPENGKMTEFSFDFLNDYPAGQMLSPVSEFARFMLMHLQLGRTGKTVILDSSTAAYMQAEQFRHHPRLSGDAVGITFGVAGETEAKVLAHGGGYPGIATIMRLYPGLGLGIYIVNNGSAHDLSYKAANALMYRFFGPPPSAEKTASEASRITDPLPRQNAAKYAGKYRMSRHNRSSIAKIGVLAGAIGSEMPLWTNDEGHLVMFDHNGNERRLAEVEPLLFRSLDDDYYMAFRQNKKGEITHVFTAGTSALEKVKWFYTTAVQRNIIGSILTVFTLIVIFYLFKKLRGKYTGYIHGKNNFENPVFYVSLFFFSHVLLTGAVIFLMLDEIEIMTGFMYGLPWVMYLVQTIPWFAVITLVYLVYKLGKNLGNKEIRAVSKAFTVLFILLSGAYIWSIDYWNLIGYRF